MSDITINTGKQTWLDNRHPAYQKNEKNLLFYYQSYIGGADFAEGGHLFKFPRENKEDYDERVKRASRYNYTEQVVNLLNNYQFKKLPARNNPNPLIEKFWKNVDRQGTSINAFIRQVDALWKVFGCYYIMVDKPKDKAVNAFDEFNRGLLPYVYGISPLNILDIYYGPDGSIEWALIREYTREAADPWKKRDAKEGVKERFRLWTRTEWFLYELNTQKDKEVLLEQGVNPLGMVPLVKLTRPPVPDQYSGNSVVKEVASLDREIYNLNSLLNQILYDQTFSILTFPVESLPEGYEGFYRKFELLLSTKAALPYVSGGNPATGAKGGTKGPDFISPDASQGSLLLEVIKDKINQIYRRACLSGEMATTSEKGGKSVESGKAKAYEFEKLNSMLATEADILEDAEKQILKFVALWMNQKTEFAPDVVDYPEEFDISSLMDDIELMITESTAQISETFDKEIKKEYVSKRLKKVEEEVIQQIHKEIDAGDPDEEAKKEADRLRGKLNEDPDDKVA